MENISTAIKALFVKISGDEILKRAGFSLFLIRGSNKFSNSEVLLRYFHSKIKIKTSFPLFFSKLFVTLASISAYHDVFGYQSSMNYVAIALVSIYSLLCNRVSLGF